MDNGTGLSASDVALLNDGGFNGNGSFIWLFAILALMGGGFNWGGNNRGLGYENYATSNEVQRGFDNQNLQAQTRDILAAVNAGTAQSVAATNQTFHDTVSVLGDKYNELERDIAEVRVGQAQAIANQNECCCNTKLLISETAAATNANIAQAKYENAMALAGLEQRLTSKMDQNEIQSLRDQVGALQLAQATAGVVRYPMSSVYSSGCNPFCGCCGGMA